MSTKTNSRKILLPLATLLVAAAVAVGSGATFTSSSQSAISATAGTLVHANSKDAATLTVTDLKPGASESGSLTITNTGSLDSDLTVVPASPTDGFDAGAVTLKIEVTDDGVTSTVFDNNFSAMTDTLSLGDLVGGGSEAITVKFTVSMNVNADNDNQGKSAGVSLGFVTTQTDATNDETDSSFS